MFFTSIIIEVKKIIVFQWKLMNHKIILLYLLCNLGYTFTALYRDYKFRYFLLCERFAQVPESQLM